MRSHVSAFGAQEGWHEYSRKGLVALKLRITRLKLDIVFKGNRGSVEATERIVCESDRHLHCTVKQDQQYNYIELPILLQPDLSLDLDNF